MIAKCLTILNINDQAGLSLQLFLSDFSYQLGESYQGNTDYPDISLLVKEINDDILPQFINGSDYNLDDLKATISNDDNALAIEAAYNQLMLTRRQLNLDRDTPSYFRRFDIVQALIDDIDQRSEAVQGNIKDKQEQAEKKDEANVLESRGDYGNYVHERTYAAYKHYVQDRFKNSKTVENLAKSKFISDVFLKNVFIDVDKGILVNQYQGPDDIGDIDRNLKNYRKTLLTDLIKRLDLPIDLPSTITPKVFNAALRTIADNVISTKYKGTDVSLDAEGTLFQIAEDYKVNPSPEAKRILDNFIDFTLLADFNKLFDYYGEGAISVGTYNDDFDPNIRKYSIENALSIEAINASWDEKVQNGVDLASPLYKTIIENTQIVNYTTGNETGTNLYPALVSHTVANYFKDIDRHNPTDSIRQLMIQSLANPDVLLTDKNVIFTLYKKFFQLPTDTNTVFNRKDSDVKSFANTIRDNQDQSLIYLITKPIMEISKVFYLEAIEDDNVAKVSDSAAKAQTQVRFTASRAIDTALNKTYEQMYGETDNDPGFMGKWNVKFGSDEQGGKVQFTSPIDGNTYTLRETGNDGQDVRTLRALSKDMLDLDFENDKRHAELWEQLLSLKGVDEELPSLFTGYLYDAFQIIKAKDDLYDEDVQKQLLAKEPITNKFLADKIAASKLFNARYPENFRISLQTQNARRFNEILVVALNRYAGNQLKSTINTVEGTQVAGFATYNYFNGIKQNHADHRRVLQSVARPKDHMSVLKDNMFINDPNSLDKFYIRGSAKIGNTIKSNSSQNVLETINFNVNLGYFGRIASALKEGVNPTPIFDITVYSDKSINPLPAVNNKLLIPSVGTVNLFTDEEGRAVDENHTIDLHYKTSGQYYRAYAENILDTWKSIYAAAQKISVFNEKVESKSRLSDKLKALNDLNENVDKVWYQPGFEHNLTGYLAARFYASKAGVALNNWVDFDNSAKSIGPKTKLLVKPALINNIALFDEDHLNTSDGFKDKLNKELVNFANQLNAGGFKLDDTAREAIKRMYPDGLDGFDYGNEMINTARFKDATSAADVNPALRKMYYDYNLIQDNLMLSTLGPIYAHKGGNENKMWITQIKRNVAATASVRNYSLGLERGVEDFTTTAFVDELQNFAKTILGDNHDVQSFDGASFETMTQRMKTRHSLNYKFNGDGGNIHKSFISHFDPKTGAFAETKHAAFAMTNDLIRKTIGANIDLMEVHKDLYRGDISKVDITKAWKNGIDLANFSDVFYMRRGLNFETNQMETLYQLKGIEYKDKDADGNSRYIVTTQNLSTKAESEPVEMTIPTFYHLWQVLGDIDSVEHTDEKTAHFYTDRLGVKRYLKANEKSAEKLLDFESYIGNSNESIVPEQYLTGNHNTVDGYVRYRKYFDNPGVVNSHIDIINKALSTRLRSKVDMNSLELLLKGTNFKWSSPNAQDDVKAFVMEVQGNPDSFTSLAEEHRDLLNDTGRKSIVKPYQRFKGSNIDRISIAGAQKVGQFNLNNISTIQKSAREDFHKNNNVAPGTKVPGMTSLISHKISNFNAGIQLSAWHETENAHVTTPTQMLNALIFNAKRLGKVTQMYEAIGSIVDNELSYILNNEDLNIPQLVQGLSNGQWYAQNKDKLLAIFKDIMSTKVDNSAEDDFTLDSVLLQTFSHSDLPLDDPQIFNSAVAELTNYFTKSGIRTKFDGMFAIIHPASDMLQFHEVQGGFMPVRDEYGNFQHVIVKPGETRVLDMHQYGLYKTLNDHLAKTHPDEATRKVAENAKTLTAQPRNLKGQQVRINFADGTSQDLSILNGEAKLQKGNDIQGGRHLIPEAHALDLVKRLVGTFKSEIDDDAYKALGQEAKIKYLEDKYKDFLKKLDNEPKAKAKDQTKGMLQNHAAVKHSFDQFAKQVANVMDLSKQPKGQSLFEWTYDLFSQSKKFRDKELKGATGERKVTLKEHEYIDKLNTVGTIFLKQLQQFLDHADKGREVIDAQGNKTISFIPESLLNPELYANAGKLADAKITVSRAEAIAPITAKNAFKIREGDNISDITEDLIFSRLREDLDYYDTPADAVLVSEFGKKVFVHSGAIPADSRGVEEHKNIQYFGDKKWYTNDSGQKLFQIPEGIDILNINGNLHAFLNDEYEVLNNPLLVNLNRGLGREGDRFRAERLGDEHERQLAKQTKEYALRDHAKKVFNTWQVYLDKLIGTRVPGQHYQSFQGMKIVGFSEDNNIHVADEVILLSGADFDIDKQNIIYHSINDNGLMALWHPASDLSTKEKLEASLELPMPMARSREFFIAPTDTLGNYKIPLNKILRIDDNLDFTDVHTLLGVYHLLDLGYKLGRSHNPNLIDQLYKYDNAHVGLDRSNIITSKAIKNFAVSSTNQIIESPSNFLYLSTGVSTDTIKQFSTRVPKQKTANDTRKENPWSQSIQKYENMMGKAGIGIMASSGMKGTSAIDYAANQALFEIGQLAENLNRINELTIGYTRDLEAINDVSSFYNGEHTEQELSVALSNLRADATEIKNRLSYLSNATGGKYTISLPNVNYDLLPDSFNESDIYESLHRTESANSKLIQATKKLDYAKLASMFDMDVADIDSQFLSTATDNAKELDLGKINGTPDYLTIFPASFLKGASVEELVTTMTTPMIDMLMRNASKDVFNKSTAQNSVGKLLSLVNALANPNIKDEAKINVIEEIANKYKLDLDRSGTQLIDKNTQQAFSIDELMNFRTNYYAPAQINTLLAGYLGINQGIPSNNWALYKFSTQMQDFVNKLFRAAKKRTRLDFKQFLDSLANGGKYHESMIEETSPLFANEGVNFNPLFVLTKNPHFAKQLTAFNASNTMLRESSYRVNAMYGVVDKLRQMGYIPQSQNINQNDFNEVEKGIEDTVIRAFITDESINNKSNIKQRPIFYDNDKMMDLSKHEDREYFIEWFRTKFLDRIKNLDSMRNNLFVKELTLDDKQDPLWFDKLPFVKLQMDTTNVKNNVQQGHYRDAYLYGLKELYDKGITDIQHDDVNRNNNVFNALFWYNLVVNRNNITKNSYAKLLGEILVKDNFANSAYGRLLLLKGKLGKSNDIQLNLDAQIGSDDFFKMSLAGVEFDLQDMILTKEMGEVIRKPALRIEGGDEYQGDGDDYNEYQGDDQDYDYDSSDYESNDFDSFDDATFDEYYGDADEDEEGNPLPKPNRMTVTRTKQPNNPGTVVAITLNGATVTTNVATSTMTLPTKSSSLLQLDDVGYNPWIGVGEELRPDQEDAFNFYKLSLGTLHDLLAKLPSDMIQITYTVNGQQVTEQFDKNKDYNC